MVWGDKSHSSVHWVHNSRQLIRDAFIVYSSSVALWEAQSLRALGRRCLGEFLDPSLGCSGRLAAPARKFFQAQMCFCPVVCRRARGIQQKHFSCPGTDPKLLEESKSGQSCSKGPCDITWCGGVARGTSRFLNRCHLRVPFPS